MSELKQRRRTQTPIPKAGQARVPLRTQPSAKTQHSVWDDASRHNIAAPRSAATLRWKGFVNRLRITDAAAIAVSVASAYVVRFRSDTTADRQWDFETKYLVVSVLLLVAWVAVLEIYRTRDSRTCGVGAAE